MEGYERALEALRLERQRFSRPAAGEEEYCALFRAISPVFPVYWSCPGSPPELSLRAGFDGKALCFQKRAVRELVKGRFQNGSIAYIFADELPLYAAVYRKAPPDIPQARVILELLEREGPLTIQLIKDFTGMLVKEITPVLHKLQTAFLVFEDQTDNEWDRAWYRFDQVFPDTRLDSIPREQALETLALRFARMHLRIDAEMLRSFYRFSLKEGKALLERLAAEGKLVWDGTGYLTPEDASLLKQRAEAGEVPEPSVYVLHRNDFIVRSCEHLLTKQFPARKAQQQDVLYYLLIDGRFQGAVYGRFRNGPFEVEDVVPVLDPEEALLRKEEILAALSRVCDPQKSPARLYCGEPLTEYTES